MHVVEGIGDVKGLVREDIPTRKGGDKMAKRARPGESSYTAYDRDIAARAQVWLHEEAPKWRDKPWVMFVSFVLPHFPLTAPPHWFYRYWQQDLPLPKQYAKSQRPRHPYLAMYEHVVDYDSHFASVDDGGVAAKDPLGKCRSGSWKAGDEQRPLAFESRRSQLPQTGGSVTGNRGVCVAFELLRISGVQLTTYCPRFRVEAECLVDVVAVLTDLAERVKEVCASVGLPRQSRQSFDLGNVRITGAERLDHRQRKPCRRKARRFPNRSAEEVLRLFEAPMLGRDRCQTVKHHGMVPVANACRVSKRIRRNFRPSAIAAVDSSLPICPRLLRQITFWSQCSGEVITRGSTLSACGDPPPSQGSCRSRGQHRVSTERPRH